MIPYIINAGLILCGCLAFYKLLLQRETFYKLNRYMLIICLAASFGLPLLPVPHQWSFRKAEPLVVQPTQNNIQPTASEAVVNNPASTPTDKPAQQTDTPTGTGELSKEAESDNTISFGRVMTWVNYLYWFGVIVFGLNFLAQAVVLYYRAYTRPVIKDGPFRIIEISGDKAPCSFGNNIFINPEKYDWDTYNQILQHEKVHIRQGHTMDILIAELVLIFQWFNPFAWLYRREVESNLEFLTDDHMVQRESVEKSSYQMSLLKVSTPHFPLSLTNNYNQSLLKKRIAMMNAKKSNVHTAWKYFFLLPLLVLFAALLNEPTAYAMPGGGAVGAKAGEGNHKNGWSDIETEGVWFATIKENKIYFHFKRDGEESHNSFNGTDFLLSDFPNLPRGTSGTFTLKREAGTMNFAGKFEGNEGMGRYKFVADESYAKYMGTQGIGLDARDQMTFFFVDVKKSYLEMLKNEGYKGIGKSELIPMAALKIDKAYIHGIRSRFKDINPHDMVAFKALGITDAYIAEIQNAGYKNISAQQIVTFKAQGIDKDYLSKVKKSAAVKNNSDDDEMSANDVVTLKAMNIDDEYVNSFKTVGFNNLTAQEAVPMKALGITPDFVLSIQKLGFKDLTPSSILPFKAQHITAEYINSFREVGFTNLSADYVVPMKALGVTPEYVKSFQAIGYKNISPKEIVPLKAQGITPEYIKEFESAGFQNVPITDFHAAKAMGITPEYIKDMKAKGFNYNSLEKYVRLKSIGD